MDQALSKKVRELADLLRVLDVEGALELIQRRLEEETDKDLRLMLTIEKSKLLAEQGRDNEAIAELDRCSRAPGANESSAYFAAEILVVRDRYAEAEEFLQRAEQRMAETGSTYYGNCIHLLHAYCAAKLGDLSRAGDYLARVTDREENLFWLRIRPQVSVAHVEELINGKSADEAQVPRSGE